MKMHIFNYFPRSNSVLGGGGGGGGIAIDGTNESSNYYYDNGDYKYEYGDDSDYNQSRW